MDLFGDHRLCRGEKRQREEKVLAHAGRLSDRVAGVEAHDQRGQRGGKAGGGEHRAFIHAGKQLGLIEDFAGEHRRLDEDDVGHRQKGGQPGEQFGADGGAVFTQVENAFEHVLGWKIG